MDIEPYDIKASHALGPAANMRSPAIIVKFLYFDQKERIWSRKKFLKYYKNPGNGYPVYMYERLSKNDIDLKEAGESENLLVATKNSAPMLKLEMNGRTRWHTINSIADIRELREKAVKSNRSSVQQKNVARDMSPKQRSSISDTPLPQLFRQPNFEPMTPSSISIPPMKRTRDSSDTVLEASIIYELKNRKNNRDDLLDYVMGLIGDTPNAKQCNLDTIPEQPFPLDETEQ